MVIVGLLHVRSYASYLNQIQGQAREIIPVACMQS